MSVNYMSNFDFTALKHYNQNGAILPQPDQYVGELIVKDNNEMIFNQAPRDSIDYINESFRFTSSNIYHRNNILVILESPHRFEYDASKKPIALIMGKTGWQFFDQFSKALSQSKMHINSGQYNVILANAVQYQTSCGLNPLNRELRDLNWLDIYYNYQGEKDLKQRIFAIKPRYTINCCTGGKNPNALRSKVTESLIQFGLKKGKHFTEGNHPASWFYSNESNKKLIE
ncbi:MAG: hypothetical protein WC152_04735 [Candidatus Izemoplasmatales bacterium]